MKVMRKKYTLLGLPANLRRYSRVNHDMQTDSINASFGLSKGFPVEQCSSSPYFHEKKQLTSEVGVLEGVHSVQAHPHCWDHHEHHAGQKLLPCLQKAYSTWCKTSILPPARCPAFRSGPKGISGAGPTFTSFKMCNMNIFFCTSTHEKVFIIPTRGKSSSLICWTSQRQSPRRRPRSACSPLYKKTLKWINL